MADEENTPPAETKPASESTKMPFGRKAGTNLGVGSYENDDLVNMGFVAWVGDHPIPLNKEMFAKNKRLRKRITRRNFSGLEHSLLNCNADYHGQNRGLADILQPPTTRQKKIDELAYIANENHRLSRRAMNQSLQHARLAGLALIEAKKVMGIGGPRSKRKHTTKGLWTQWLNAYFDGTPRLAQLYMRVARYWNDPTVRKARLNGHDPTTVAQFQALVQKAKKEKAPAAEPEFTLAEKFRMLVADAMTEFDEESVTKDHQTLTVMVEQFGELWDLVMQFASKAQRKLAIELAEKRRERIKKALQEQHKRPKAS